MPTLSARALADLPPDAPSSLPPKWRTPLPRAFYTSSTTDVASALLGQLLIRVSPRSTRPRTMMERLVAGRIVETEAYLPSADDACHAARGSTPRNAVMFGRAGHAYIYAIHARWCFNVVTESPGAGCAVLIRAVEPWVGRDVMHERRATHDPRLLARGPARLAEAFDLNRDQNGLDLTVAQTAWITAGATPARRTIARTPRIGVTAAQHAPLRFAIVDNPWVSDPRPRTRG